MKKIIFGLLVGATTFSVNAQMSLTALNTAATEDFASFDGSGFAPSPAAGQLDSDMIRVTGLSDGATTFGGTHVTGDFARGATVGGVSTGGVYAVDDANNFGLFVQPGGSDFTPGTIEIRVTNNTGNQVDSVDVSYDILVFNDQARGNTFNFSYSTDGVSFTSVPALDFTSPAAADAAPALVRTARSTTITGLAANFQNGDILTLQFSSDDSSGSGSRDEIGMDTLSVTATSLPVELMNFEVE